MTDNVKDDTEIDREHIRDIVLLKHENLTIYQGIVKPIRVRKYMTADEVNYFLSAIPPDRLHHHLFFKMLWHTGLRVSEALSIRKGDIDYLNGNLRVIWLKKRKKAERYIPLHPDLLKLITYYVGGKNKDDLLFPFSRVRASQLCEVYRLKARLDIDVHCHMFRHSFAVHFLSNSSHIGGLKTMLGHRDIRTTAEYLNIVNSDIRDELMRIKW